MTHWNLDLRGYEGQVNDLLEVKTDTLKFWPLRGHAGYMSNIWEIIIEHQSYFWNPWPKKTIFWPLNGHEGHISDLQEVIIQNQCYLWNTWPIKPILRHPWDKKWQFEIFTSQRSWRSFKWPPRGDNPKLMLFLKSLTHKTYI